MFMKAILNLLKLFSFPAWFGSASNRAFLVGFDSSNSNSRHKIEMEKMFQIFKKSYNSAAVLETNATRLRLIMFSKLTFFTLVSLCLPALRAHTDAVTFHFSNKLLKETNFSILGLT